MSQAWYIDTELSISLNIRIWLGFIAFNAEAAELLFQIILSLTGL